EEGCSAEDHQANQSSSKRRRTRRRNSDSKSEHAGSIYDGCGRAGDACTERRCNGFCRANRNTCGRRSRGCPCLVPWRRQRRRSFRYKLRGNQGRPIGKSAYHGESAARGRWRRAKPRHSDGRTAGAVKQKLPFVTIVGSAERSNAGGGVRLVSGHLKPEARFRLTFFANAFNLAEKLYRLVRPSVFSETGGLRCM